MEHIECIGVIRNTYNISTVKLEGKRVLERLRYRWEYNTAMDLKGIKLKGVD